VNPDDVANLLEHRQVILVLCEESHTNAAIVQVLVVERLLSMPSLILADFIGPFVVHAGVNNLDELSVLILCKVWSLCVYYNSIEIIQACCTQ